MKNGATRLSSLIIFMLFTPYLLGQANFLRGDANNDRKINLADPAYIINALFKGGPPIRCLDAADANDDGSVGLSDAAYLLQYEFLGGPKPPPPFPSCGVDVDATDQSCPPGSTSCP